VLLKNENAQLPLEASRIHSLAVIGAHSDVGMISGGGSAQVDPAGGNAIMPPGQGRTTWQAQIWFPTSPLKAIRAKAPGINVQFDAGKDLSSAAALAKSADVAIVFAYQWESEGMDLDNLSLPEHQDDLIAKVAAANPRTIVVLETGSPVTMPWADQVSGILEAWYAGSRGAEALANLIFGDVNPTAKLPITFPKSEADLPHATIRKPTEDKHFNSWEEKAPESGIQVVRRRKEASPFSIRLRSFLHHLSLFESPGQTGPECSCQLHRGQHRQSGRSRDCAGLRHPPGRRRGTAEAPGGLEQGEIGCGRE
jgi:hypothetical protein